MYQQIKKRVAVTSLLYNWPSKAGGAVHTKELCEFLSREGVDLCHFVIRYDDWRVGNVIGTAENSCQILDFHADEWNPESIRRRLSQELTAFDPDLVVVTDSWNTKVLLCEAAKGYPYFIRLAALECVCPLNNVRLVPQQDGPAQCSGNQLTDSKHCRSCVDSHMSSSGGLHMVERQFSGFFDDSYPARLQSAFANAAGILVVNPGTAELVRPTNSQVHVVPSGFDESRFPRGDIPLRPLGNRQRILFAGQANEYMKGFHVLATAVENLFGTRQDFEVWVTDDDTSYPPPFRSVGWQAQTELPSLISCCDILVFPTVAQEGLGRTVIEAMGCGRPVVASDIGGLSWVVQDGVTGLLVPPGDATALCDTLDRLLSDRHLQHSLAAAGRKRFESQFTWSAVIRNHYNGLLNTEGSQPDD